MRGAALSLLLIGVTAAAADPPPRPVFHADPPFRAIALRNAGVDLFRLVAVTNAGDGRLFLVQQQGLIHVFRDSALLPQPFLDLRAVVSTGGERGLLALAFSPDYVHDGRFFVLYTDLENGIALARYRVAADDPDRADSASGAIVLRVPSDFQNHNGGQILFGPDGHLYLSLGDGGGEGNTGGDPECHAQQATTLLGKILRFPMAGGEPGPPEVWATGLRNPWRFSFDRATGDLYIGDVGEDRREEIDFEPAGSAGGRNYGWKVMEGSFCFSTGACPAGVPPCGSAAYTAPVLEYDHGNDRCAVTGGLVYRGTDLPHLFGAYLFGDLCNGQLWAAQKDAAVWKVHELTERAQYVTSFGEDVHGEVWLVTLDGRLLRLAAAHPVDTVALFDPASSRLFVKDFHVSGPEDRSVTLAGRRSGEAVLAGDWDGDGKTTPAFYDRRKLLFQLQTSLSGGTPEVLVHLRPSAGRSALPLAGDWTGRGHDSVGFYDPAASIFELKTTDPGDRGDQPDLIFRFGPRHKHWLPIVGDWNGDGRDDVGLYDPVHGVFRLRNAGTDIVLRFGPARSGWLPVAGDWDGDGRDGIGLYDPATSTFFLKSAFDSSPAEWEVRTGPPAAGRLPLAGEW